MPDESTPDPRTVAAAERASAGMEANRKGKLLERAVALIETTILRAVPDARAMNISVQPNKRVNIDGVRHEIDLYVELAPAKGYEASFIFECKNQEEAVSKNAIIVFSEKVRATKAQKGYFIAPRFTSDALAQARQDKRIEIVEASIQEYEPFQTVRHMVVATLGQPKSVRVSLIGLDGAVSKDADGYERLRLDGSELIVGPEGSESLLAYVNDWFKAEESQQSEPIIDPDAVPGTYEATDVFTQRFENVGKIRVQGRDDVEVAGLEMTVVRHIALAPPRLKAIVNIGGRGRTIHLEPMAVDDNTFEIVLGLV